MDKCIVYKRKSTDSEDKQVLSLDSQNRVIKESVYNFNDLTIIADYEESMTAKAPGRPKFNEMCETLESGKAQYIICWALNRLARNPVDGGRIIWAVQNYGIKILTPGKTYDVNDILLMYVEFAMSNQFITDLKKSTARGIEDKIRAGIAPILAPIGYYNDVTKRQGLRDILVDLERFELVRKMWELLLTGNYSPVKILDIATNEWGLRHRDGRPISRSKIYELFRNIFYTGQFVYDGKVYQGVHKAMITLDEYDRAQRILGKKGAPRMIGHQFSFTRLIKCICGAGITAHERYRKVCPICHYKYNAEKNEICPRCSSPAPEKTWYACYYHCSSKSGCKCKQKYITETDLETQIDNILASITLPEDFVNWTLEQLRRANEEETQNRQLIDTTLASRVNSVKRKLDNLLSKFLSETNINGELISDEEYKHQKQRLQEERKELEEQLKSMGYQQDNWISTAEQVFNFTINARYWFNNGSKEQKRQIVSAIGLNLTLNDRLLRYDVPNPFLTIQKGVEVLKNVRESIVPEDSRVKLRENEDLLPQSPVMGG